MIEKRRPLVVIESPYAGDTSQNVEYAKRALADSIRRGEAPFASHLLYTQVLDDTKPDERELGVEVGFSWGRRADLVAVYRDYGISHGMRAGMEHATLSGLGIEFREIGTNEEMKK